MSHKLKTLQPCDYETYCKLMLWQESMLWSADIHHQQIVQSRSCCKITEHLPWAEAAVLHWIHVWSKRKRYLLGEKTARWTYGHYPPGKFLLLGFPAPPQGKAVEQRVTEKRWAESGVLGDRRKWLRQTPVQSPTRGAVVLSSRQGWDKLPNSSLSSATSCFLHPLSLKKGKKKKGRGWGGWGRLNENQTQPCLVWMRAVGRMMSQIWGGIFSLLFHTFDRFSIYVCGTLSPMFQHFGEFVWFSV